MEKQEYLNDGDRLAKTLWIGDFYKTFHKNKKPIFVVKWKYIKWQSTNEVEVPEIEILQSRRILATFLSNFYRNGKLKCYHKQMIFESRLNKLILKQ